MASDPLASAIDELCELAHKVMTERVRLRAFAQAVLSCRGIDDDLLMYEAVKHGLLDTSHCSTKLLTGDDDGER